MRRIFIVPVVLFVFFTLVYSLHAGAKINFTNYDKIVTSDLIRWYQDSNSATIESLRIDEHHLKEKILNSSFHSSAGSGTYGTLLDFITALSKIGPMEKIEIITSDPSKSVAVPYSVRSPLISAKCLLNIVYKHRGGKAKAYYIKFLYYSDSKQLKTMAKENDFPNSDSMGDKTTLIALEEEYTDKYPGGYVKMDPSVFITILSTQVQGIEIKDYIKTD